MTAIISSGISTRALNGVDTIVRFRCSFCESEYDSEEEARKCLAAGFECHVKVGDIIVGGRKYGWVEGDAPHWIYDFTDDRKKTGSHLQFGYRFYHVAVAITRDMWEGKKNYRLHFPIVHYVTLAMKEQGRHSQFKLYYARWIMEGKSWRFSGLPVLPREKPENNNSPFHPEISKVPAKVRREAAGLLELKKCPCGFNNEHETIGWTSG